MPDPELPGPDPRETRASASGDWPQNLRGVMLLTGAGMVAERVLRAFWPLWAVLLAAAAALMLGLHESLPIEAVWFAVVGSGLGGLAALWRGARQFRWPRVSEVASRIDAGLPGRPIAALQDRQAIGAEDPASRAVWEAHRRRMTARLAAAVPVRPDLRLSRFDPYGLRHLALILFATGLLFGSVWRAESIAGMAPGRGEAIAAGPAWEGWIEPPRYTARPTLYLADIPGGVIEVPKGSKVTARLYGAVGALTLTETVSARTGEVASASDPVQDFTVEQPGAIEIDGPGGRRWQIAIAPDAAPHVSAEGPLSADGAGVMSLPFSAADDYGVELGRARVTLDLAAVDRRFGLSTEPEPREPLILSLPLPISGDRHAFAETLSEDLSTHPWANLPVKVTLEVEDALGQTGQSQEMAALLPGRRFFVPLAKAIIEQRQAILWNRANAAEAAAILRSVSNRPEGLFRAETDYMRLRFAVRSLESALRYGPGLTAAKRDEIAQALWDLALRIEDGNLSSAMERLRRAQDQLAEAIRDGASDEEIARLMQELREAMNDYMRQLAEQAEQGDEQQAQNQESMEITGDQLQDMLDRLQQLMQEGRMAEAAQMLEMLRQMMENMQAAQSGQNGQPGPGQQALQGLQQTLREQQDLSDEGFRDLQNQFGQPGQQPGQGQQPGRDQGQGQGQDQGQGQGQGQDGQAQGQGGRGQNPDGNPSGNGGPSLADRQQALRDALREQQKRLPGEGGAGDALDRAGRAMEGAEEALRNDDIAGALDRQSEAIDALRDGMQALSEEMAREQQQGNGEGQDGKGQAQAAEGQGRDPLGRATGTRGNPQTGLGLLPEDTPAGRARELQDEIRRRATERERPEPERNYLNRLLDRF